MRLAGANRVLANHDWKGEGEDRGRGRREIEVDGILGGVSQSS